MSPDRPPGLVLGLKGRLVLNWACLALGQLGRWRSLAVTSVVTGFKG